MRSPLCAFLLLCYFTSSGQIDSVASRQVPEKRLRNLVIGASVGYGIVLTGLHQLWYKDSEQQSFHFFNDNAEWKQVDKLGHFYSAFYFGYGTSCALRWAGYDNRKTDAVSALTAFAVMLPIEILDGHSDSYGASAGDLVANAGGALFFLGQKKLWNEIRLTPKFSFHHTDYAAQRPTLLGENNVSEVFKDYNGQTYWLSVDIDKFVRFPKWLNVAAGYGAEGMIYARSNQAGDLDFEAYRQYYLSLDLDVTAIKTRSKALKTLLFAVNMIKFPLPTLEFSRGSVQFKPFYF